MRVPDEAATDTHTRDQDPNSAGRCLGTQTQTGAQNQPVTAGVLVVVCGVSFITRGSCQQAVGSGLSWTRAVAVLQDTV